jgi:WD40 repeat protein
MLRTIKAHKQRVVALAIAADGKRFASASQNDEVKIWETETGKELAGWSGVAARSMTFAPDGEHLATANWNTTVYLLKCP